MPDSALKATCQDGFTVVELQPASSTAMAPLKESLPFVKFSILANPIECSYVPSPLNVPSKVPVKRSYSISPF